MNRSCSACKTSKPEEDFGRDKHNTSGFTNKCKECRNQYYRDKTKEKPEIYGYGKRNAKSKEKRREYYARPEVVKRMRNAYFIKTFEITLDQYDKMLSDQQGKCKICGRLGGDIRIERLVVDHNHVTDKIRGLLCQSCNRGMGLLKDSLEILGKAINYLREYD